MNVLGNCQECGCACNSCAAYSNNLDLQHEVADLRSQLVKSNKRIEQLQTEHENERGCSAYQVNKLQDELAKLRHRYDRLMEPYKKSQKINHDLEDKLLTVVQNHDDERSGQETELISLNSKLMDAKYTISDLEQECERYRSDCFVAVQLLQCKPSNFVAHKLNTLPLDVQQRVKVHLTREEIINMEDGPACYQSQQKMIRVAMPTFPPTAMVYSINNNSADSATQQPCLSRTNSADGVPMNLIAKVLSPPEAKRNPSRYYVCSKCREPVMTLDVATQTGAVAENNGYPRAVVANMRTNPPTILAHYPGVHVSKSRGNSFSSDIASP